MIEMVEPTRELVTELAPGLRAMDKLEVKLSAGMTPEGALLSSWMTSEYSNVVLVDGRPVAMFGCAQHSREPSLGIPWFLGTPEVYDHRFTLIREGRRWIEDMNTIWPTLTNAVYAEHRSSINLMVSLGFHAVDELPNYGVHQSRFILFVRYV